MIKVDSYGNEEWSQNFSGLGGGYGNISVHQTFDNGYIFSWKGFNPSDIWLIKTDSQGNQEWIQSIGGSSYDNIANSVQQTTDDGYIVAGSTSSFGNGSNDVWLIKTDGEGNEVWDRTFGGSGYDYAYSVQQTSDGGYIVTGYTSSFGNGANDFWIIKTNSDGYTIPIE